PLRIDGNLRIIATDGTERPPVLAPAILPDNSSIDHFMQFIGADATVELNDIYMIAFRADNTALGWSDGIRIDANNIDFTVKNSIFDGFSHTVIQLNGQWCKMDVQDNVFRNNMHPSSWFGGGAFLSGAPVAQDTNMWINNTFFCNNSYNWSDRGFDTYSVFEHNTMVYNTVNPFLIRQANKMHINNNLFYAAHAMGGNPTHVIDGWFLNYPDTASSSILRVRAHDSTSVWATDIWGGTIFTGPDGYIDPANGVTADMVVPSERVVDWQNNAFFNPQALTDFYTAYNDTTTIADSIGMPDGTKALVRRVLKPNTVISEYAQWTIDNILADDGADVTVANNDIMDPGFSTDVNAQIDNLIAYVHKISTGTLDVPWYFDPNESHYPPAWPLPENLAYSNTAMQSAGTDGFALGDLNWFPEQKNQWLTDVKTLGTELPTDFELSQNYPNPFNPETNIRFKVASTGNVKLVVFNILGQKVKTLFNDEMKAGSYQTSWNGTDDLGRKVASGTYLLSIETDAFRATKKMMLLK
ncbi:MAG: T9SS type A sorting domain-containing protein, partial [Ignavibacteriae bacterium]|nr:T9SS type A sorting domain-containing protein [Ignavibacteriota bacterium]